MTGRFDGRTAIVTGAKGGIGLAVCKRLASEGANVVLADRSPEEEAVAAVRAAGSKDAFAHQTDVADEAQVIACCDAAVQRFGRLDVIVNNAGMMVFKTLEETDVADWKKVLDVDLLGAVHFTKQAFRLMSSGGAIVNVASVHAVMTTPLVATYAAAKAATLSLTRSTAIEGKSKGIRANVILPGAIDTPMLWTNPNLKSGAEKLDPADVGQPDDIAAAVAFLAADEARFVTGATLAVDGGRLAKL
jgi:NAD(P)-dependent dehydrogenase (short-subunit alcohol dehydrogenase family)